MVGFTSVERDTKKRVALLINSYSPAIQRHLHFSESLQWPRHVHTQLPFHSVLNYMICKDTNQKRERSVLLLYCYYCFQRCGVHMCGKKFTLLNCIQVDLVSKRISCMEKLTHALLSFAQLRLGLAQARPN